jgi:hypothetical protein
MCMLLTRIEFTIERYRLLLFKATAFDAATVYIVYIAHLCVYIISARHLICNSCESAYECETGGKRESERERKKTQMKSNFLAR